MLRLFKFLKPYTIPIITTVILVFIQVITELYLPTMMSDIVNKGIVNSDVSFIMKTGGLMLLIAACGVVCAVVAGFLSAQVSMGLGKILREKIFIHVTNFSLHEFDKLGTPSLITRNTNDITQIQNVVFIILRMMLMAPMMCIGGMIMALSKDKGLAWVIFGVIPILSAVIIVVAVKGFPLFQAIQKKIDKINLILREGLTGIRVIRAFNRGEHEKKDSTTRILI